MASSLLTAWSAPPAADVRVNVLDVAESSVDGWPVDLARPSTFERERIGVEAQQLGARNVVGMVLNSGSDRVPLVLASRPSGGGVIVTVRVLRDGTSLGFDIAIPAPQRGEAPHPTALALADVAGGGCPTTCGIAGLTAMSLTDYTCSETLGPDGVGALDEGDCDTVAVGVGYYVFFVCCTGLQLASEPPPDPDGVLPPAVKELRDDLEDAVDACARDPQACLPVTSLGELKREVCEKHRELCLEFVPGPPV